MGLFDGIGDFAEDTLKTGENLVNGAYDDLSDIKDLAEVVITDSPKILDNLFGVATNIKNFLTTFEPFFRIVIEPFIKFSFTALLLVTGFMVLIFISYFFSLNYLIYSFTKSSRLTKKINQLVL